MRPAPAFAKAVVRAALWFCASNLLVVALAAQCSNPTQVPNQTISSGTWNFSDNNALAASNVIIQGSASVNFVAGNCIHLRPGFHATAGTAATTFHAWVQPLPDFTLSTPQNTYSMVTGVPATPAYTLTVTPINGFSSPVSFSVTPFYGCGYAYFSPPSVAGPPWTTTLTMSCSEPYPNTYVTTVQANGGGLTRTLPLYLQVTAAQQYSLSTSANPPGAGSITLNPPGGWYNNGTQVQVLAAPAAGYTFTGFTGNLTGTALPQTLVMTANKSVTANFTATPPGQYSLTTSVNTAGAGTITPGAGSYISQSQVTITATPASGYQFSGFTGTVNSGSNPLTVTMNSAMTETANFVPASQYTATTIADLNSCIQNPQYTTCALAANTYTVTDTILINRSNVTVSGGSSDRTQTKLVRSPTFTAPIVRVDAGSPLSGITMRDLVICGSSTLDPAPPAGEPVSSCPRPPQPTTCGNITAGTAPGNHCVDFEVGNAALPSPPADPFTYAGPYAVTVSNVAFEDATGHAVSLYANKAASKKVNDIYITGSAVNRSEVTGILAGVEFEDNQRKDCDYEGFKDDPGKFSPRNIRIEGNWFVGNNTGALGINQARWFGLRNNIFKNNYRLPQAGNIEGGTVFFDQCVDKIDITGNTMTGPAYRQTGGLELWGRNITVRDNPNISGYGNAGIELNSVEHTTVTNNNIHDNNQNRFLPPDFYRIGGIQVWTSEPWNVCRQVPRDTNDVKIYGNTSSNQAYGIGLGDRGEQSRNILNLLNIYSNILEPYATAAIGRYNPFVMTYGSIDPAPMYPSEAGYEPSPRALSVDAVGPAQSLCQIGTAQTFTFSGADLAGAASVRYVQGYFSTAGDEKSGPTGPGCHFIYDRSDNRIYLDGPNGDFSWPASSPLGAQAGGYSIGGDAGTNPYCVIHAASPNSNISTEDRILNVQLDIEFRGPALAPGNQQYLRVYESIQNNDGLISQKKFYRPTGGLEGITQWPYVGWWVTQPPLPPQP